MSIVQMSLSAWRAWIEIYVSERVEVPSARRSLLGERGLKSILTLMGITLGASLSAWRAWIEISELL